MGVDLPPQRGPGHDGNGHSHGSHGHSHGGHGHSHGHGTAQRELTPEEREKARQKLHKNWDDDAEEAEMGTGSVFWNAIGATLLISAAPFFILFFIPLDNSEENQWILKI